jgi:hypothetical protein
LKRRDDSDVAMGVYFGLWCWLHLRVGLRRLNLGVPMGSRLRP